MLGLVLNLTVEKSFETGEVLYHTEAQNSFRKSLAFDEILWGLNLRVDL